MRTELFGILAVGLAAATLIMARIRSLRKSMRTEIHDLPGPVRGLRRRTPTAPHRSDPAAGRPVSEQGRPAAKPEADRPPQQDSHDVLPLRAGKKYDPRPLDDKARRRMAYVLIALLALQVNALTTMVLIDVIAIEDIKEFGVIIAPLVALVSAATGFYFATKGN